MGSGTSGLYVGTYGANDLTKGKKTKENPSKEAMHQSINQWAISEKNKLSKTQQNKFNTACIACDCVTGNQYYGRNNGIKISGDEKNPILFGENDKGGILPTTSLNHLEVGRCAEVDAVNKALNSGAKLENLYMLTIHTRSDMFGELKKACENCTYAFKDKIKENYAGWSMED